MFGFSPADNIPSPRNRQLYAKRPSLQKYVENPFLLEGTNGKGVLLVHGWTASPYETYWLAEFLNRKGYTTYSVLLSGHGKTPAALEKTRGRAWVQDVEDGYVYLQKYSQKNFVVGNSLGGALALLLASKHKEILGLVVIGTPYKTPHESFYLLFGVFKAKIVRYMKKVREQHGYTYKAKKHHNLTHLFYPTTSALEVLKIIKKMRGILPNVSQPLFFIQSTNDRESIEGGMELLLNSVQSSVKKKLLVPKTSHNFLSGPAHAHVFKKIHAFLGEIKETE